MSPVPPHSLQIGIVWGSWWKPGFLCPREFLMQQILHEAKIHNTKQISPGASHLQRSLANTGLVGTWSPVPSLTTLCKKGKSQHLSQLTIKPCEITVVGHCRKYSVQECDLHLTFVQGASPWHLSYIFIQSYCQSCKVQSLLHCPTMETERQGVGNTCDQSHSF